MKFSNTDIDEALIQAHEEGRVVFFCGAGVSMSAGLPNYENLVMQIYNVLNVQPEVNEQEFMDREEYHNVLTCLENRLQGGRETMIEAIHKILQLPPKLANDATDIHKSIIKLSVSRKSALRLVTTNYDSLFEIAVKKIKANKPDLNPCIAPMLTVPKNTIWNNLVFLHGKLPETIGKPLPEIIASSGDFGRAYLIERWASRFVSELFRNYIVCFIGYSVNDPIMRYMMDALAADGERKFETYAFASCNKTNEKAKRNEWEGKKITPILYKETNGQDKHRELKMVLVEWANHYQNFTRESVVDEHFTTEPYDRDGNANPFADSVAWAILDPTYVAIKKLVSYSSQESPIEWLFYFSENEKTRFFFFHSDNIADRKTRQQILWIVRWLMNHINNPKLFMWIVNNAYRLNDDFNSLFKRILETELSKRNSNKADQLKTMRTPWGLFLTNRLALSDLNQYKIYKWKDLFLSVGYNVAMRIRLKEILTPKIKVDSSFDALYNSQDKEFTYELIVEPDCEVILELATQSSEFAKNLPLLLNDFQQLLIDAMELCEELNIRLYSSISMPSIEQHRQNSLYHQWTILVVLLRNAWIETTKIDKQRATDIARYWSEIPYLIFKRLALFAASFDQIIPPQEWSNWLLSDNAKLLWGGETMRETMRLLVKQGRYLSIEDSEKIVKAIISAPDGYEANQFSPHEKWLRLIKLKSSGADIGENGNQYLDYIADQFPDFKLHENQQEEFSSWMEAGWVDSDAESALLPKKWNEIIDWLESEIVKSEKISFNPWRKHARRHFMNVGVAFRKLIQNNNQPFFWPLRMAFYAWGDNERIASKTWRYFNQFIASQGAIDKDIADSVGSWLSKVSDIEINPTQEVNFVKICKLILSNAYDDNGSHGNLFSQSINHPIGKSAEAFFKCCIISKKLQNNTGLPNSAKQLLTQLFDIEVEKYKYARCILSPYLITLYQIDPAWTKEYMLPLYNWNKNYSIANYMWIGFLHSPRVTYNLFEEIKSDLIESRNYYNELDGRSDTYVQFVTNLMLYEIEKQTFRDLRQIIISLPSIELIKVSNTLLDVIWHQKDREGFYINHIKPFLEKIWPQETISDLVAQEQIAENFARLSIETKNQFPDCFEVTRKWLVELRYPFSIIHLLGESDLCEKYPEQTLDFLSAIIGKNSELVGRQDMLLKCLTLIADKNKSIKRKNSYIRLLVLTK